MSASVGRKRGGFEGIGGRRIASCYAPRGMAGIVLSGVTKAFPGGAGAVSALDLEGADGEVLVLVGPSGSGETTVLRLGGGLEGATAGGIRVGRRDRPRPGPPA